MSIRYGVGTEKPMLEFTREVPMSTVDLCLDLLSDLGERMVYMNPDSLEFTQAFRRYERLQEMLTILRDEF